MATAPVQNSEAVDATIADFRHPEDPGWTEPPEDMNGDPWDPYESWPDDRAYSVGFLARYNAPVDRCERLSWNEVAGMLFSPTVGPKDGAAWMPADIDPGPRKGERVRSISLLVLDVEAKTQGQGEDKRVIGSDPPAFGAMRAEIAAIGWRALLHTSYSHSLDHPRYRLVFDLSRPLKTGEVRPLGEHVALRLGIRDACDLKCLEPARLFYLPRSKDALAADFEFAEVNGAPLDVEALLADITAIQNDGRNAAQSRARGAIASDEEDVIGAFNRRWSPAEIIGRNGYRSIGNRWLFEGSSTGIPGVVLLPESEPQRIFSHHDGDPLATGHACNAFDCFVLLEHGGDVRAAVRAAADALGISHGNGDRIDLKTGEVLPRKPGRSSHLRAGFHPVTGDEVAPRAERPRGLPLIDISKWTGDPPPRRSLWGDMLPLLQTTMLTGMGGIGKSLFEQALTTHIALGRSFLGLEVQQRNVLYVTCEDDEDELWRRQEAITSALGATRQDLIGKLHLCSLTGQPDTALATFDPNGRIQPTDRWHQLQETCEDSQIGLYAFDNATDAMAGDLNDIHQVAEFVNMLTGLAIRCDGVAMIIHHPNKAGEDWLGSVAWHNKVRSRLIIEAADEDDDDARTIRNPKANYGPRGGKVEFRWHRGTFVREEDLPADYAAEMNASIRASSENKKFLECLAKTKEEKRAVSLSPSASNYAPRVFSKMTLGKGVSERGFAAAMERLLHLGTIANDVRVYQRNNRAWVTGLGLTEVAPTLAPTPAQTLHAPCTDPHSDEA